jgi:hypothetical protein
MHVTVSTIAEAVIDVMRAATPSGVVDQTLAGRISADIAPALEKALTSPVSSGAELSGLGVFRNILSQHLATPASAYVEAETRKAMQRTLDNANRTGSEFSSLVATAGARLMQGAASEGLGREGASHGAGERVSAAALTRDTPLSVDSAISFAKELGINPSYAGLFAGGSQVMRDALRDAITKGASITDDQVKSMKDVGMVLGAIRAGKLAPDDPRIPDSIKKVIGDMNAKGLDPRTADLKTIRKYLDQNPDALAKAKQQGAADEARNKNLSHEELAKISKAKGIAAPAKKHGPQQPVATTTL